MSLNGVAMTTEARAAMVVKVVFILSQMIGCGFDEIIKWLRG